MQRRRVAARMAMLALNLDVEHGAIMKEIVARDRLRHSGACVLHDPEVVLSPERDESEVEVG